MFRDYHVLNPRWMRWQAGRRVAAIRALSVAWHAAASHSQRNANGSTLASRTVDGLKIRSAIAPNRAPAQREEFPQTTHLQFLDRAPRHRNSSTELARGSARTVNRCVR